MFETKRLAIFSYGAYLYVICWIFTTVQCQEGKPLRSNSDATLSKELLCLVLSVVEQNLLQPADLTVLPSYFI